jgi:hypothetical protein
MPKRKCTFNDDLQKEFAFLRKTKLDSEVNCTQCNVTFSVSHGGRSDIKNHMKSGRHKKAVESLASKGSYFTVGPTLELLLKFLIDLHVYVCVCKK